MIYERSTSVYLSLLAYPGNEIRARSTAHISWFWPQHIPGDWLTRLTGCENFGLEKTWHKGDQRSFRLIFIQWVKTSLLWLLLLSIAPSHADYEHVWRSNDIWCSWVAKSTCFRSWDLKDRYSFCKPIASPFGIKFLCRACVWACEEVHWIRNLS